MPNATLEIIIKARDESSAVLRNIEGNTSRLGSTLSSVGKIATGFLAANIAFNLPGQLMGAAQAAADSQAAIIRLQTAVANSGGTWAQYGSQLDAVTKSAEKSGFADEQTRDALALMIAQTGSAEAAQGRLKLAMDLARGAHIDLYTASKLLGKATDENVSVLSRYGITIAKGAGEAALFGAIQEKFGGQADAFAKSAAGQMAAAKVQMHELSVALGATLLPAIVAVVGAFNAAIPVLSALSANVKNFIGPFLDLFSSSDKAAVIRALFAAIVAGFVAVGIAAAAAFVAENAALFGIPIAIAAVVAAIVLLVRHWDQVKAKTIEIWTSIQNFLDTTIGKIILGLTTGGIGLAILWVIEHFNTFRGALGTIWHDIVSIANSAVGGIIATVNVLIGALEAALNAIINVINKIPDIKIPGWVPGIGGKSFGIPDISPISIPVVPTVDLTNINITFPHIGFDIGGLIGGGVKDGLSAAGPFSPLTDGAGAAGAAAGAAVVVGLVPAFVQEMQRQANIAKVIADAISARNVNWDEVAQLYTLGAIEIAQDFTAAMQGELSNIGAQIAAALAVDQAEVDAAAAAAATKAGIEAAKAYVDAFQQGLGDLQSAISSAFGSISQVTGTRTLEDALLERDVLLAQRDALQEIAALEMVRAIAVQRLVEIQAAAASEIGGLQSDIAIHRQIIGALQEQLKIKQDTLANDQATLQLYQQSFSFHEGLLKNLQSQLKSVQDERAAAWAVLGQAPGGSPISKTLKDAATDVKSLQDQLIAATQRGAGGGTMSALNDSIAAAQATFNDLDQQSQSNIDTVQNQIDQAARMLEIDAQMIANTEAKISADLAWIDIINAQIDAENTLIAADNAEIEAIKTKAAAQEAALKAQIDQIDAAIQSTNDYVRALQDEQAARAANRQLMQIQLELENDLLQTDAELLQSIQDQIATGDVLSQVLDRIHHGIFDVRDAFVLLGLGLNDLALLILQIVANPALGGLFPGGAPASAGGAQTAGTVPQTQTIYIQNVTLQGDPRAALAALGAGI